MKNNIHKKHSYLICTKIYLKKEATTCKAEIQETNDKKEKVATKKKNECQSTRKEKKGIEDKLSEVLYTDQTEHAVEGECNEQSSEEQNVKGAVSETKKNESVSDKDIHDDLPKRNLAAKHKQQKTKIVRSVKEYGTGEDQEVLEDIAKTDQQKPRSVEISTHKPSANEKALMNVRSDVIDLPELESKTLTLKNNDKIKEAFHAKHKLNRELSVIESPIQGLSVDVDTETDFEEDKPICQKAKLTKNDQRKLSKVENIPKLEALNVAIDTTDVHVLDTNTELDIKPKKIKQNVTGRIQSDVKTLELTILKRQQEI